MHRTIMILLAGFLLTLAAGGVLGHITAPTAKVASAGPDGGWLAQQLQLLPEQRAKVQAIWDQTHSQMDSYFEQRKAIDREFQESVQTLLTDQQKAQYRTLQEKATASAGAIDTQVQGIIDSSIEQTKGILTPEQKDKYEQLLARFPAHHPADAGDHLGTPPGFIEPKIFP